MAFSGMRDLGNKLRFVFLPFLAVSAGFVAGYSILTWALVYRTGLLPGPRGLWLTIFLPGLLPWIPALLWVAPRIRLLELDERQRLLRAMDRRRGPLGGLFLLVAVATMASATIFTQHRLWMAAGRLTRLGEAPEIARAPVTRYYALDRPCVRREAFLSETTTIRSGRGARNLDVNVWFAVPFCGERAAVPGTPPSAWLGVRFEKTVPDGARLPQVEQERATRAFTREAEARFAALDLTDFSYLVRLGRHDADERNGFEAVIRKGAALSEQPIVLVPGSGAFEARAGRSLLWALLTFAAGSSVYLLMLLVPRLPEWKLERFLRGGTTSRTRSGGFG